MKHLIILLTTVLSLILFAENTQAQNKVSDQKVKTEQAKPANNGQNNGPYFVDQDKNGVCDNFENGNRRQGRRNGQGCGRGRGNGKGQGRGGNFVDTNNDGVCDNFTSGNQNQNRRMRQRNANCRRASNN